MSLVRMICIDSVCSRGEACQSDGIEPKGRLMRHAQTRERCEHERNRKNFVLVDTPDWQGVGVPADAPSHKAKRHH